MGIKQLKLAFSPNLLLGTMVLSKLLKE